MPFILAALQAGQCMACFFAVGSKRRTGPVQFIPAQALHHQSILLQAAGFEARVGPGRFFGRPGKALDDVNPAGCDIAGNAQLRIFHMPGLRRHLAELRGGTFDQIVW